MLAGLVADALGLSAAMWVVAAITLASGVVVATRMSETLRRTPETPAVDADGNCVEPSQLDALRSLRLLVVVDVRSPAEFAAGHVTGAVNVPLDALDERHEELRWDALLVTVCGKGGGRSERAAERLRELGFRHVRSLCGGTDAWQRLAAGGASQ